MIVMAEISRFLNWWLLYYFKVTVELLVKVTEEISLSVGFLSYYSTSKSLFQNNWH